MQRKAKAKSNFFNYFFFWMKNVSRDQRDRYQLQNISCTSFMNVTSKVYSKQYYTHQYIQTIGIVC